MYLVVYHFQKLNFNMYVLIFICHCVCCGVNICLYVYCEIITIVYQTYIYVILYSLPFSTIKPIKDLN